MLVYALLIATCFVAATQATPTQTLPRNTTRAPAPRRTTLKKYDIYRAWYKKLDRNNDDRVDLGEYLRNTHPKEQPLRRQYYENSDKRKEANRPGLDFYEFQKAVKQNLKDVLSGKYNTFDIADKDKNGEISFEERLAFNKARYGDVNADNEYLHFENAMDENKNGGISRKEYLAYIKNVFDQHARD